MAASHPRTFHGALRSLSEEIWRRPGQKAIVRTVPAGTLHADLSWGRTAARLLLSPTSEAAVVSAHDPNDFFAYQRPPAVAAGIAQDLRRLAVWHLSTGHRTAYVQMAALPHQAARDAWAATFVAGPSTLPSLAPRSASCPRAGRRRPPG